MALNIFKKKREKDLCPQKLSPMGKVFKDYGQFSQPKQLDRNCQKIDFLDKTAQHFLGQ
jgi:hypothetical protein